MNAIRRIVPAHLRFLVSVHLLLLLIFTTFRSVTLLYNRPSYFFEVDRTLSLWEAFKIGFYFDVAVASYALLLPYVLMTLVYVFEKPFGRVYGFVRFYCGLALVVSLIICAADVPYFNFFNSRLTTAAVHWKNNLQVAKYIISEVKYYPFILIFVAGIWAIRRLIRTIWIRCWCPVEHSLRGRILSTGLASLLLLWSLWGGATPKTPDMKRAYFSNDGFINQLTLNPVHTWFDSYFDFDVNIYKTDEAIARVREELGIKPGSTKYASPIAREHRYDESARPMNVVLILMESFSTARMGLFGNPKNLTPGLDDLARRSVLFDNCYSNGIHTNAGLYSTLYGMPIRMMQHPMYNGQSEYIKFTGLPVTLRDLGYQTLFFCTHPKTFDNLDVFLQNNGFDHISDVSEYPRELVSNAWGVPDETLFAHARTTLDSLANRPGGKPFFATILTITTHPPFTLPAYTKFKPTATDPIEATYQYSDWAISEFMKSCADQPWYDNTIFVLVGDHGFNSPAAYDVPLSYNHVPLIIHAPALFDRPEVIPRMANQTDIFPTVMGLLRHDYVQNTLGYDLFRERRPFAFFSQDHKMGVVNDRFLFAVRKSGTESLFDYRSGSGDDLDRLYPTLAESMKDYACAQLQVAQWMIQHKMTGPQR